MQYPELEETDVTPATTNFLAGGGEMGALIGEYDWTNNPRGVLRTGLKVLKTAVRIMLISRQPRSWARRLSALATSRKTLGMGTVRPITACRKKLAAE